jgi:hypothetical protein
MSTSSKRVLRIFVASPGDVTVERQSLVKVITELNMTLSVLAPDTGIVLELVRWETHAAPGLGEDPQAVINTYIDDYDVFIGVMWQRFGTPTQRASSGTEEEFDRAYRRWQESRDFPVLFYFCQKAVAIPRTTDDVEQLRRVVEFRAKMASKGLFWEYDDPSTFADIVRPQLLLALRRHLLPAKSAASALPAVATSSFAQAKEDMLELARQYEHTRAEMPWGPERTRAMAGIFSRMRSLAASAHPLLDSLATSPSPGGRLGAVAILIEMPQARYVNWLAERPARESAFLAYHATQALLQAVRQLGEDQHDALAAAIRDALAAARGRDPVDPNQIGVLENAQRDLEGLSSRPT